MNKNKKLLFMLVLLTFIISVNLVSATEIDNNQTTDTISQLNTIENTEPIHDSIQDTNNNEISKNYKENIKSSGSNEVDVNNYTELVREVKKIQQGTQKEYTINLKPGNYNATSNMTLKEKNGIRYKVIINGNNIELDGRNKYSFMNVTNCTLELNNITLTRYRTEWTGMINVSNANISIINSQIINNKGIYGAGAIFTDNSNCTIYNSIIANNSGNEGGVICSNCSDTYNITNSIIENNTSQWYGGVIYSKNYNEFTIKNSSFSNNIAKYGGVIYSRSYNKITISNSALINNMANSYAGAIYTDEYANYTISNTLLINNTGYETSGLIYSVRTNFTISNSTLANNTAQSEGGAIWSFYSNWVLNNSTLANNSVLTKGGAIYSYYSNCSLSNTTLINNKAKNGGAVYLDNSTLTFIDSTFTNNIAEEYGGAIYNSTSVIINNHSTFKNNTAESGNDIYNYLIRTIINLKKIPEKEYRDQIIISGNITKTTNEKIYDYLNLYILVNNARINITTNFQGQFSTNIKLNSTGKWTVKAIFERQNQYLSSNNTITFNVTKRNTTINTKINDAILLAPTIITGNLTDKSNTKLRNANIYVTIGNQENHLLTDYNGTFTLNYTPTKKGTYNLTILYRGNNLYESTSVKTTFKVVEEVIINSSYYRDNITIKAYVTKNNEALKNTDVNLTINNETITVKTDENGIINYKCKSKNAGTNTLIISYDDISISRTFITKKRVTKLTTSTTSLARFSNNKTINIKGTLKDKSNTILKNANIYIKVNNQQYHVLTDSNGTYLLKYIPNTLGKNNITIVYKGNKNYEASNITRTLNVYS